MEMSRFGKRLVNRRKKGERNVAEIRQGLDRSELSAAREVLELGCGVGFVSAFLADSCGMVVKATDRDSAQIRVARETQAESDRLQFEAQDAAYLTYEDARFDLVVAQNVFHHIPDWRKAIAEVSRVLKKGGHFIWYDLVFPRAARVILGPLAGRYGLYSTDEFLSVCYSEGLGQRFGEKVSHGPFGRHHLLLQKVPEEGGSATQ